MNLKGKLGGMYVSYFKAALMSEALKAHKSKAIWLTGVMFTLAPLMGGLFMFVLKDPTAAEQAGLLGKKAQIAGEANWPAYVNILGQMIAVGGIIVFGFTVSWIFGREFSDRTIKNLLALPYGRTVIVLAKFTLSFMVNSLFVIYILLIGFLFGFLLDLPGWHAMVAEQGLFKLAITSILTILLMIPVAFFATIGRGYLAPIGFIIVILVLSQLLTAIGFGHYIPWAFPAIISGMAGESAVTLSIGQLVIIIFTICLGIGATIMSWLYVDHS